MGNGHRANASIKRMHALTALRTSLAALAEGRRHSIPRLSHSLGLLLRANARPYGLLLMLLFSRGQHLHGTDIPL